MFITSPIGNNSTIITPVVFIRYEMEVVSFLPQELSIFPVEKYCSCYMHIGQHCSCIWDFPFWNACEIITNPYAYESLYVELKQLFSYSLEVRHEYDYRQAIFDGEIRVSKAIAAKIKPL
ncbi:MAG: hypothetical protein KDD49_05760 [Bacteroidetes bacterium]|nr:hypothetical protein [Bacteroidota bacterium]